MGDGASSSNSKEKGGGDGGGGETVVVDHGRWRSSCGYCRSPGDTSISHGLSAHSITVDDYQELLDQGWRRSGCFLYKPEMHRTCCPSYTIRLKAGDFVPSKEQLRVHKKMQRYLDGKDNMNKVGCLKIKPNSAEGSDKLDEDASSSKLILSNVSEETSKSVLITSRREPVDHLCENMHQENELIDYLSSQLNEAVNVCIRSGEFPASLQLPKAVVKKVTSKTKRKLVEISEDLLYTSSISFQIAAALRHFFVAKENNSGISSEAREHEEKLDISPSAISGKLANCIAKNTEQHGLITKACNGHLNFYSTTKQISSFISTGDQQMQASNGEDSKCKQSCTTDSSEVLPCKRRRLEIRMKRSSFDPEEFALYRRYQIRVHDDKPEKVTESSYKFFLVDTPVVFVPPHSNHRAVAPCGFGSFHQQYVIDGKLVAVGVVDILPRCLSSKYLFWDPDLAFLSLGKYSALQEINWVKEAEAHCPSLQYYYLGYYIHSCSKMRYKAAYRPSELLCPFRFEWVPFESARPLLDKKPYVVLSDCKTPSDQEASSQLPSTSAGRVEPCNNDDPGKAFSAEDEELVFDLDAMDSCEDNESDSEDTCTFSTDGPVIAAIGDIMIDLNGPRVKFKDLQRMFGPIDKRYINELERQLWRYVRTVGQELSNRMVYSLG